MNQSDTPQAGSGPFAFLVGGGEMGRLIRAMDWSQSSLGPVAGWPQSLRTTISICLASDLPICVIWGPRLVQIYNDAYRVICGDKHPRSMGQNFAECWMEAWPVIGQAHDQALAGDTAFLEAQHIFLERHGFWEECFFTFSFSPIRDEAGQVGGLFHPVIEMTAQMLSERRTRALRDLAVRTSNAKSVSEALSLSAQTLHEYGLDLPFVLLYALDPNAERARLVDASGLTAAAVARLSTVELGGAPPTFWWLEEAVRSGSAVPVSDLAQHIDPASFTIVTQGGEAPKAALAMPIIPPGTDRAAAILIAGCSPSLPMNDAYRGFYDLLAASVSTAVANARAYEDERRRVQALAELDQAKTAFFANVSHEFRTPLTLMLGPLEDALTGSNEPLPPLQHERLEVVYRNGLRLQRLVNSLLDFSRIEAGRVRAAYEPTALADFTADLASNFRSACERAGLSLRVDCPPLAEPVFVDRAMWEKVVLNLLSNAFKFTFEGHIAVSMRPVGHAAELRVQDTGGGIPAKEIPLLFERFHRVENARGRTHEGSGIGLALVQELVKLHGGSVSVESEVGRGTTFTVRIPLGTRHLPRDQIGSKVAGMQPSTQANSFVEEALRWLPPADQRPAAAPAPGPAPGLAPGLALTSSQRDGTAAASPPEPLNDDDRPYVLVVDDNADMRQYVVRLLSEHYRTMAAADGEAALAAARAQTPDLVLTDVMMPRLDGFGLLRALRADPRTSGVPVILLSARAGEESRVEGMEEGADDYLVKPFSARELRARVTAHLQMARMRREAGESIRTSEARLRALLSATSEAVYRMSADWSEMRQLQGRDFIVDTHEPNRSWLAQYIPPDDQAQVMEAIRAAIECKGVFELEHRVLRVDGSFGWTLSRAIPMLDGNGEITEWFGAASDVTARRQAEAAIRVEEGRTRTILASITDGFFALDTDWRFTYINAAGERILDRTTPGDLIGKCVWDEYPGTVGSEFDRVYRRVIASGVSEAFTAYYPNFDRWYEAAAHPSPEGLSVYFRDVSEKKQTEERLRASEARRRLALDAAELGMWHVELPTRATQTDARFRAIFGTTAPEWTDYADLFAVMHPDDVPAVTAAVAAATRLEDPTPYAIEYRIFRPDGSLRWVFAKGLPSFEGEGQMRRVVSFDGTVADITDRKRGEEEREQMVARLQEQDQRKDEFLATLAHELRNPLAPIRNGLQIMRLAQGNPEATERARSMMERQVGQMVHLVDDLLDLSRISLGKIDLRKKRIELAQVIAQAIETSRPSIEQAGHSLLIDMAPDPICVDADLTRLAQVFTNLLNNAAKFTARGGRIRLAVQAVGGEVVISVEDNGVGIPTHLLAHVFETFAQVNGELERSQGGLGIGLSLVKRLVAMHGGSVEARSDGHGRGSEFVVRLPVALSLVGDKPPDEADAVRPTARRRILVVDDNFDSAASLAMLLTLMGHETQTAHDGLEALDAAQAFRPDAMLLDIGMPKLNGYDVCLRIRQQAWGKEMLVIAMSGWGQDEDKRQSLAAGFDAHLVKPLDPAALEKLLTQATAARA